MNTSENISIKIVKKVKEYIYIVLLYRYLYINIFLLYIVLFLL